MDWVSSKIIMRHCSIIFLDVPQVHAYIISSLKKEMPSMFGKDTKKKELVQRLSDIFAELQREHQISPGDFPDLTKMQEQLQHQVQNLLFLFCFFNKLFCFTP